MKNRISLTYAVCMLFLLPWRLQAQDVHFSQFFEAPLLRNPSLAGIFSGDVRIQGVYRNQWASVTVPYKTGSFNMEYKKPVGQGDDFLTLGMQVVYDKAGSTNFTTTQVLPALNYHKAMSDDKNSYLSLGFMAGVVNRNVDRSKMTFDRNYDNLPDGEVLLNPNYTYFDGSVGMSYNAALSPYNPNSNYFIGVAYHHLNRPKNSFYKNPAIELNPKWVFSGGIKFDLGETSYLTLQADHNIQGAAKETIGGALYSIKIGEDYDYPDYTIHFGGFLRWQDAFIPVLKLDYRPFSVAMSYDVNVSQLKTASQGQGGMELSVTYASFLDRDNSSKNATKCPKF